MPLIVDAHEDLAWNMLELNRDYSLSAQDIRLLEAHGENILHNGSSMLGWKDYQLGKVAVIFSTLFVTPERKKTGDWETQVYKTFNEAHQFYRMQLDRYHRLVDENGDKFGLILGRKDLDSIIEGWSDSKENHKTGLVILMEGAEGVRNPDELDLWWQGGVRIIGPAWAGTRFCGGTREPGPMTEDGWDLLDRMADMGISLDLSHMDELAARQALDRFPGTILASHANCADHLNGNSDNRMLKDGVIRKIIERNGVIGVVPILPFLIDGWEKSDGRKGKTLEKLFLSHIDHICQLAGDARHAGIGTDYDGGFGVESAPEDVDTIADLQKLVNLMSTRGYTQEDIELVMGRNWLRVLEETLPD